MSDRAPRGTPGAAFVETRASRGNKTAQQYAMTDALRRESEQVRAQQAKDISNVCALGALTFGAIRIVGGDKSGLFTNAGVALGALALGIRIGSKI